MRYFYSAGTIFTLLDSDSHFTCFRVSHRTLAIMESASTLLAGTDPHHSITLRLSPTITQLTSYTPYGFSSACAVDLAGFNGTKYDATSGCYLLGNGYRAYSPTLMRFLSADNLSPFKAGGLNAYNFVGDDPINYQDNSGHVKTLLYKGLGQRIAPDAMIFRKRDSSGMKQLILDAHGDGNYVYIDDTPLTPQQLITRLKDSGVYPHNYAHLSLCSCNTAQVDNGKISYAQAISDLLSIPVEGYEGNVRAFLTETPDPSLPAGLTRIEHRIFTENPSNPGEPGYSTFSYKPKTFYPSQRADGIRKNDAPNQ